MYLGTPRVINLNCMKLIGGNMVKSLSLPVADMEKSQWDTLRAEALRALQEAIRAKGKKPEDYDYIDLKPTDLGFSDDVYTHSYSAATTWETLATKTLDDDNFLVIYGVYNKASTPLTVKIRFWKGSIPIREYYIDRMYVEQVPKTSLGDALVYAESDTIKIDGYASATGTDELGFIGIKAIPKGREISAE